MKKVLVVWYDNFNYLSGIVEAFKEDAQIQDAKPFPFEFFGRGAKTYERFLAKRGARVFEKKYYNEIRARLLKDCEEYKPDIILILNAKYRLIFNKELFDYVKNKKIIPVVWFVDSIKIAGIFDEDYLKEFGAIYSFECDDIEYIKKTYNIDKACYLPLGADTRIYNKNNFTREKLYDVCFVGAYDEKRLTVLESVAEYCVKNNRKMAVFGHMWRNRNYVQNMIYERQFKKKYPSLHRFVTNEYLSPEEVAKVYAQSKICLNIVRAVHSGANPRSFEIMATGSFQLVDYSEKIELLFENHKHLVMYKDTAELEVQLEQYLTDDQLREQVAANGHSVVIEKYTLPKLVRQIIEDIEAIK